MSRPRPTKRRRVTPPQEDVISDFSSAESSGDEAPAPDFLHNAAKWDLEQDYETRPRTLKSKANERSLLPIRTSEGWVNRVSEEGAEQVEEEDSFVGTDDESGEEGQNGIDGEVSELPEEPKKSQRQQILEAKEELAKLASQINEDPEDNISKLKQLAEFAASENITIKKLGLATQLTVYKDLIPGYRIRALGEDGMKEKVSKEVKKLREFEQSLVTGYQKYVRHLTALAKGSRAKASDEARGLGSVAIMCACTLLTSVPHFNFRGDLLKIVVDKMSGRRVDDDFRKCADALETLFRNDEDGNASLDAVKLITQMVKERKYNIDEAVLNTFLHLRLLSELSVKGSRDRIDGNSDSVPMKRKFKKEFRTKKQKKQARVDKSLEKEMTEADAAVSHEERDKNQSETLKMVFITYFRILKDRTPSLMGAVLEGLAKYAHLINQDFFGDILEALKDLIDTADAPPTKDDEEEEQEEDDAPRNPTRSSLLCVITAFALLQGQDAAAAASTLHLDLTYFIQHLYRTLLPVSVNPDIELSVKSLRLPDPHSSEASQNKQAAQNKVNVQTTIVLLIRSLTSVLLPQQALRAVPPVRIAAFAKQLMSASLHLPEKSCLAMLGLMTLVTKAHGKKIAALWNTEERRGDGTFDPLSGDLTASNPFTSTIWEGELLRRHYAPKVRDAVLVIEKNIRTAMNG